MTLYLDGRDIAQVLGVVNGSLAWWGLQHHCWAGRSWPWRGGSGRGLHHAERSLSGVELFGVGVESRFLHLISHSL